jgi:hypothetical protein
VSQDDPIDTFIERSSLGEPAVKLLRSRTSPALADVIVACAERRVRIFRNVATYEALESKTANQHRPKGTIMSNKKMTPGTTAPRSGQYQERGPRGGTGREVTVVRGEPLPPTTKPGSSYTLVDPTRNKSGRG